MVQLGFGQNDIRIGAVAIHRVLQSCPPTAISGGLRTRTTSPWSSGHARRIRGAVLRTPAFGADPRWRLPGSIPALKTRICTNPTGT